MGLKMAADNGKNIMSMYIGAIAVLPLRIDCASLARIWTLGPVIVREFVSFMR